MHQVKPEVRASAQPLGGSFSAATHESRINELSSQLKSLEGERDEALRTAESCAKTTVRLTDMVQLLEKLALEKVTQGDEAAAKQALKEKASVSELMEKSNVRAQNNFTLAAALANRIGIIQAELLELMQAMTASSSTSSGNFGTSRPASTTYSASIGARQDGDRSGDFGSTSGGASSSTSNSNSSTYRDGDRVAPWQQSLLDAQQRLREQQEREAAAAAAAAASPSYDARPSWQRAIEDAQDVARFREAEILERARALRQDAEASVIAARERLSQRAAGSESLEQARARLRSTSESSIVAAQQRLREQDQEALAIARRIVQRLRRGEYVSDDQVEWAFRQLDRVL